MNVFTNKHVIFAILSFFLGLYGCMFWQGFIGNQMIDLGFPGDKVGFAISL